MKICAIVLNYRDAAATSSCLKSLAGQGLEMALIVDNSADARMSADLAEAMQRLRESEMDFDIHTVTPPENLGFSRGVNMALSTGMSQACDTFLLINNDAIAAPGMVERLAAIVSQAFVAIPVVLTQDGAPQPGLWYQRFLGMMAASPFPGAFAFPSGCCLMFRKELLKSGKLLDEDFFMYGEDVLLGWRLMLEGKMPRLVEQAVVYHTGRASAGNNGLFYEYHTARAHVLLAHKTWHNRIEIPLLLLTKSAGMLLRAVWRTMRGGSATPLLAFFLAWFPLNIRPDHGKRTD